LVRVNLINPKKLADQHLIAEYNEILMLIGHVRKFPSVDGIPEKYVLGPGHIKFFKDKLKYVKKRHEVVKKEMKRRGFRTDKSIDLSEFHSRHKNDWKPTKRDFDLIKERISWKVRKKPSYYRYEGEVKPVRFFLLLLEK